MDQILKAQEGENYGLKKWVNKDMSYDYQGFFFSF